MATLIPQTFDETDHVPATSIDGMALSDPLVCNEEYLRVPGDVALWTARFADGYGEWLAAKANVKYLWATLLLQYRTTTTPEGKAPSEKYVEACIEMDILYRDAVARRDALEVAKIKLGGYVDAIKQKGESLIGLGANIRKELSLTTLSLNTETQIQKLERQVNGG
jgi:hypothetical protein